MTATSRDEWSIGFRGLKTKWAEEVTPETAWNDYPRPQLERDSWMNLNGIWDYCVIHKNIQQEREGFYKDGNILVPFPIESALSGVQRAVSPDERLWYKRSFELPQAWSSKRIILHFGAVDWETHVWVNGQRIGVHKGGYCPFSFDITEACTGGVNDLLISVWDPTDEGLQERGKQSLQPQGLFYTAVTGIWQSVWLEAVHEYGIEEIRCTSNIDRQCVDIELKSITPVQGNFSLYVQVRDQAQIVVEREFFYKTASSSSQLISLSLPDMKLWSPERPFLYDLHIEVRQDNASIDYVRSYFAMRKCSIERDRNGHKRLCLNNEPLFQHGVLDQGYWPDGLYTAPCDEALIHDIKTMKAMGFNMIRKHIKIEPARWYYHCDRLGMLVWQDMISGGSIWNICNPVDIPSIASSWHQPDYTEKSYARYGRSDQENRAQFWTELQEMIDRLYHFPSIVLWCPFHEAWGQFDAKEIGKWVQLYDQTRFVNHASGWNDQNFGEIKSVHTYFRKLSMPRNTRDRAIVISEYGGYSLLIPKHNEERENTCSYKRCKTSEELHLSYNKLIQKQLLPLIERGVSAAVYSQVADVEGEASGLMTYDRKVVKLDENELYELHRHLYEIEL